MDYQTSESIVNIAKALDTFHQKMSKIIKENENPYFKSKYAGLPVILEAIKEPLHENGLTFTQFPIGENGLITHLIHISSGEWMKGGFTMTPANNNPQGQGSVITYQRRYALGAILGLNIDEDDDGNAASTTTKDTAVKNVEKKSNFEKDLPTYPNNNLNDIPF